MTRRKIGDDDDVIDDDDSGMVNSLRLVLHK
jgi:hypothetical protein